LADPTKQWIFNPNDTQERKLWNEYMLAYETLLNKTSTEFAPWYLIPANHNWYRNLVIARVIVDKLESLNMHYSAISGDIETYKKEIQAS
jgi:polyphosphate kinase 2 (PPK2 family)